MSKLEQKLQESQHQNTKLTGQLAEQARLRCLAYASAPDPNPSQLPACVRVRACVRPGLSNFLSFGPIILLSFSLPPDFSLLPPTSPSPALMLAAISEKVRKGIWQSL